MPVLGSRPLIAVACRVSTSTSPPVSVVCCSLLHPLELHLYIIRPVFVSMPIRSMSCPPEINMKIIILQAQNET